MTGLTLTKRTIGGLKVVKATERPKWMNILVYGKPGVGKTALAGTADDVPAMQKVLFVDIEGGTLTLTNRNPNIDIVRVESWLELQGVYDELYAGNTGYSTVVIDSLTEAQKFDMAQVLIDLKAKKPEADADIPGMREWGINIEHMRKFVRAFRDLPMNCIFTALVKEDKDPRTGLLLKKPYMSGKLADEVAGFLDIVMYMYLKEVDGESSRLLLSAATPDVVAKDRTGRLPMVIQEPRMIDLLNAINGTQSLESGIVVTNTADEIEPEPGEKVEDKKDELVSDDELRNAMG